MLEIAIWIGVVLCGVAALGVAEFIRAKGLIQVSGDTLKTFLPIAALTLLMSIAGAMAALFFFLFFLSDYWEYALIFGGLLFAFLVVRIRRERTFFASAPSNEVAGAEADQEKGGVIGAAGLVLQVGTVAALLVLFIPVLTGGFLIYMVLDFIAGKIIGGWIVLLPILAILSYATYWAIRRRINPPS